MANKSAKAPKAPKTPKTPKAPKVVEAPKEKVDKSFPGSLRRLAAAFRAASVWDNLKAAAEFEAEADLLDPKGADDSAGKKELAEQTAATKAAVDKAEKTLADPKASAEDTAKASADLTPTP